MKKLSKGSNKLSPRLQIGDFGCGEAKIMEATGARKECIALTMWQ
jgi:hypothetical protein